MIRSRHQMKKLVLGNVAVRELKLGELAQVGGGDDAAAGDDKSVPRPPEPGDVIIIHC